MARIPDSECKRQLVSYLRQAASSLEERLLSLSRRLERNDREIDRVVIRLQVVEEMIQEFEEEGR